MEKVVSAADANRKFSKLLHAVREWESYIVTSHGSPVAKILPCEPTAAGERAARAALLQRLRSQAVVDIGR
jgi:prevent-host-death family protein